MDILSGLSNFFNEIKSLLELGWAGIENAVNSIQLTFNLFNSYVGPNAQGIFPTSIMTIAGICFGLVITFKILSLIKF